MFDKILQALFGTNPDPGACGCTRDPKWEKQSREFLVGKSCVVCGGPATQTHHIFCVHLFPQLEMVQKFWRPVCTSGFGGLNCHLEVAHGGNFRWYNPQLDDDAAEFLKACERIKAHTIIDQTPPINSGAPICQAILDSWTPLQR
jgi:hypothetical protein